MIIILWRFGYFCSNFLQFGKKLQIPLNISFWIGHHFWNIKIFLQYCFGIGTNFFIPERESPQLKQYYKYIILSLFFYCLFWTLYYINLYYTTFDCIMLCYVISYWIKLFYIILHYIILYYIILYYIILYYIILYYFILFYFILFYFKLLINTIIN